MGDMQLALGNTNEAFALYEKCRAVLVPSMLNCTERNLLRQLLCTCYERLSSCELERGNMPAARAWQQQGFDIALQLTASDAESARCALALSDACEKLGSIHWKLGDVTNAYSLFAQGCEIAERLLSADPFDLRYPWQVAVCCSRLASISAGDEHAAWDDKDWNHRRIMVGNVRIFSQFFDQHLVPLGHCFTQNCSSLNPNYIQGKEV
jgi:hypothetical protein